jgi:hypothetical protein
MPDASVMPFGSQWERTFGNPAARDRHDQRMNDEYRLLLESCIVFVFCHGVHDGRNHTA